jgi:hypothetical protein
MKVWPIDPLIAESFSLEVSEKLPQGLTVVYLSRISLLGRIMDIWPSSSSQSYEHTSPDPSSDPLGSSQVDSASVDYEDLNGRNILRLQSGQDKVSSSI